MIGLDSADAELIEQWSADGTLPTLAALRRDGTWGRLRTTAEVMHVSAWPTIYTGVSPGHHGMYHAFQIRVGEQAVHRTRPTDCPLPPFWKLLDRAGRKCVVMDAFMGYPLDGFHGVQILEYGTWTWFSEPSVTPNGLGHEVGRRFGRYPGPEHSEVLTVPEPVRFRDRLIAGAGVKRDVVRWLLREQPWEMAFVTFAEPHGAGHYLWHVGDKDYPAHPPGRVPGAEHALREVYAAVDQAIGSVLAEVDDDATTVFVVSGDGMGPNYAGSHLLPDALRRLGIFRGASGSSGRGGAGRSDSGGSHRNGGVASAIRQAIPLSVRHAVTRCLPRSMRYRLSMKWVNSAIDWERTKVFCIPNSNEGYLRVNLEGREPRGTVAQGAPYEDLLAEMQTRLSELVVPSPARPAVQRVVRIDDVFPGPERRHLPDLVVSWDAQARVLGELYSERCGPINGPAGYQIAPYYTGNHRPNAFVLARGPHVSAGTSLNNGHILDLPATIVALLGVDPPSHFEGRAWSELLPG